MGYISEIFEWEGDDTQPFSNFEWLSRQYNFSNRLRFLYARAFFTEGDFDAFEAALAAYNDLIDQNLQRLSANVVIHDQGPWQGWQIGTIMVAGSLLNDVGAAPTYAGDKSLTLEVYTDNTLVFTKTITNERPFRIGQNRQGREWEFKITGNVSRLQQLDFATSMQELRANPQGGQ